VPATVLAREAIDLWLRQQARLARHAEIAAWAAEMAGSSFDLDPALESAGIELLTEIAPDDSWRDLLGRSGAAFGI
jgi:hypothetical protein